MTELFTAGYGLGLALLDLQTVGIPVVVMCAIGAAAGVVLTFAARIFAVPSNPKVDEVRGVLPGVNCGACGYVGCDEYARAVASGVAATNLCVPGASVVAANVAKIMGSGAAEAQKPQVARVRCNGDCNLSKEKFVYAGMDDCFAAAQIFDGHKACSYGCLGHGNCVRACPFNAIDIVNNIAVINESKCKACRKCVAACPKHLIEMVDKEIRYTVFCQSEDKGPQVKKYCDIGCIGCTKCVKVCPTQAISMTGPLAYIDWHKCINCGKCAEVCPTNAIICIDNPPEKKQQIVSVAVGAEARNLDKKKEKGPVQIDTDAAAVRIRPGQDAADSTQEAISRPLKDSSKLHTIAQTGRLTEDTESEARQQHKH